MKLRYISFLIFLLLTCNSVLYAEEISITTYYPSPYGSYNELQLYPHALPNTPCNDSNKGYMYYDSDDDTVYVCKGTSSGWGGLGGGDLRVENGSSCPSGYSPINKHYTQRTCSSQTQCTTPVGWGTGREIYYLYTDGGVAEASFTYDIPACVYHSWSGTTPIICYGSNVDKVICIKN